MLFNRNKIVETLFSFNTYFRIGIVRDRRSRIRDLVKGDLLWISSPITPDDQSGNGKLS
ncbi:hypothetical protein ZOSMA_16G01710 [Zostera marina]|uniref:Uncharacterized protein n=1 Tax=Zostera marina TaxID=29655 RepID=A0A0K9PTC3_ZOSMR|nr:hypothetical protein ZOSMA_16G01710 [Zostera marina]